VVSVVVSSDQTELLTNCRLVVNTTNDTLILKDGAFCVDSVVNSINSVVVKFCQNVSIACREAPCVQKCCPVGEIMTGPGLCEPSNFEFNPRFYNAVATDNVLKHVETAVPSFAVLSNLNCPDSKFILQPEETENDVSYLLLDGRLYAPGHFKHPLTTDRYCLEKVYILDLKMDGIYTFLCFSDQPEEPSNIPFILCSIGLITSSFFLFVTFLVYACLPSLQNLHGKTLMCYVVSLFAAYVCLSGAQLGGPNAEENNHKNNMICVALGESIHLLKCYSSFFL
jgi:hypothetical protein